MGRIAFSDDLAAALNAVVERAPHPAGVIATGLLEADNHTYDYLGFNDDGFSFIPSGKKSEQDYENWNSPARQTARPNRIIRTLVPDKHDSEYERFLAVLRGHHIIATSGDAFQLVSGENIRRWYLWSNHSPTAGTLSCMTHQYCQPFLDIYVDNPEVVQMLIHKNAQGKLDGRMLVWTTRKGTKIYDRIYGLHPMICAFQVYAEAEGWKQAASEHFAVQLKKWDYDYYPYMDNMNMLRLSDGLLRNYGSGYDYCFDGTGGDDHEGMDGYGIEVCEVCGNGFHNDDLSYTAEDGRVCDGCLSDNYSCCHRCGEWYTNDDVIRDVSDNYWCDSCAGRWLHKCEECDEWSADRTIPSVFDEKERCGDCHALHVTEEERLTTLNQLVIAL